MVNLYACECLNNHGLYSLNEPFYHFERWISEDANSYFYPKPRSFFSYYTHTYFPSPVEMLIDEPPKNVFQVSDLEITMMTHTEYSTMICQLVYSKSSELALLMSQIL